METSNKMQEEINLKMENLKEKLENIKNERDQYYLEAKEYEAKRNEYNDKVSEYLARIQELRELRNQLHTKMQLYKEEKAKIADALEFSQDEELEKEVLSLQEKIRSCVAEYQDCHSRIMQLNKEMNDIKEEANALQEKYLERKKKGEKLHKEYLALSTELHNLTKITNEMKKRRDFVDVPHATELENQAIMERKDYARKAELFKKAAKIRDENNDKKGAMSDWANYYLIKANILSRENKFMVAKKYFDCAEHLFLETDQKKSAYYTVLQKMRSLNIKLKKLLYHKKQHDEELKNISIEEIAALLQDDFAGDRDYIKEEPVVPREDLSLQEAFDLYFKELDRFFELYQEFSNDKHYILRQISFFNKKAIYYQRQKNLEAELKCYGDSIDFLESLDMNTQEKNWFKETLKKQKACFYFIKGKIENDFAKSAVYYKNAAKLWNSLGNEKSELYNLAYHNYALGRLHELEDLQKAKSYYGKAIEIWDRLNNTLSKKYTYAYYYHVVARLAEQENDLMKAKNYYLKAAELWHELGNEKSEKYNYAYLNHVYAKERSESEECIPYYQKAIELWRELGNTVSEKFNLAHYYHAKAKFSTNPEEKIEYYKKASELWNEMGNEKSKTYNLAYYYEAMAKKANRPEVSNEFWKKAKELWEKVSEKRNAEYCEANYLSGAGRYLIYNNNLEKGRDMLKKAEEVFNRLGIRDSALFSRYHYVKSYEFEMKENQAWDLEKYIKKVEEFLEDFEELKDNPRYVDRKISYYKNLSLIARKENDLKRALEYTEKCYQYCQEYYKTTQNEAIKQDYYYHKSVFHKIRAKSLIAEGGDPTEIKNHLLKACEFMEKVDKLQGYVEWSSYYKYLAWLAVPDEESFNTYLKKAMKFAKKARNQKLEIGLEGFEIEGMAFREEEIDKKLELYKTALEKYKKISDYEKVQCLNDMLHYLKVRKFVFENDIASAFKEVSNLAGKGHCVLERGFKARDYEIIDFVDGSHLLSVFNKIQFLYMLEKAEEKRQLEEMKELGKKLFELSPPGLISSEVRERLTSFLSSHATPEKEEIFELKRLILSLLKEEFETKGAFPRPKIIEEEVKVSK